MIYCILGVFKDEFHIFSVLSIYIHVRNDSVDEIRELSQNERNAEILHLLEDLLHVLELNQIQSPLSQIYDENRQNLVTICVDVAKHLPETDRIFDPWHIHYSELFLPLS